MALKFYNTLTREKEIFTPINAPHVGFYSDTSLEEVRRRSAQNVTDFFNGKCAAVNILNISGLKDIRG